MSNKEIILSGYKEFLIEMKKKIREGQIRAAISVNSELVMLYWKIGRSILDEQNERGWGSKVIERLSKDLTKEFPDMRGFSVRNLKYMLRFAKEYSKIEIVQQLVAQIPWGHNVRILDKISDPDERLFYIRKTIENGWSRNVLLHWIESGLYLRNGKAQNNFQLSLPKPGSDLAHQLLKDPYNFDFLSISDSYHERELEKKLIEHIRDFLLELGTGFAYIGNQIHLDVGDKDFYIDMLFYHLRLKCYIVIDLKTGKFIPEYVGKMNFYLAVIDDIVKSADDNPSIGLILCKDKDKTVVEYTLKGSSAPMGVSTYELTKELPKELKDDLPSIEEIEKELMDNSPD